MIMYEVKAFDKNEQKVITFNHQITKTLDDAIKFANHLKDNCEWYSNISVIVLEYELIKMDVFNIKGGIEHEKI